MTENVGDHLLANSENPYRVIKRDQEEAGQKDCRKALLHARRNSPPEGPLVDSGIRTRNLAAMSGDHAEPYEPTAGNWSSVDRGLIQFVGGSSLPFRKTGACVGFTFFGSGSPKAKWCSLALVLPLYLTTSPK